MFLGLNYKHRDTVVIDVVDDTVMGRNVARIGHIVSTYKRFGVTQACAGMLHDVHQNLRCLLEELRVGLLPLAQRPVGILGILNRVNHKLLKYRCISSGVLHLMVSPLAYSRRALLIERRMAGVMVLSSLRVTVRTDDMPRIIFSALRMSATTASDSSVTIIWDVCGNVIDAIILTLFILFCGQLFFCSLLQK